MLGVPHVCEELLQGSIPTFASPETMKTHAGHAIHHAPDETAAANPRMPRQGGLAALPCTALVAVVLEAARCSRPAPTGDGCYGGGGGGAKSPTTSCRPSRISIVMVALDVGARPSGAPRCSTGGRCFKSSSSARSGLVGIAGAALHQTLHMAVEEEVQGGEAIGAVGAVARLTKGAWLGDSQRPGPRRFS